MIILRKKNKYFSTAELLRFKERARTLFKNAEVPKEHIEELVENAVKNRSKLRSDAVSNIKDNTKLRESLKNSEGIDFKYLISNMKGKVNNSKDRAEYRKLIAGTTKGQVEKDNDLIRSALRDTYEKWPENKYAIDNKAIAEAKIRESDKKGKWGDERPKAVAPPHLDPRINELVDYYGFDFEDFDKLGLPPQILDEVLKEAEARRYQYYSQSKSHSAYQYQPYRQLRYQLA